MFAIACPGGCSDVVYAGVVRHDGALAMHNVHKVSVAWHDASALLRRPDVTKNGVHL